MATSFAPKRTDAKTPLPRAAVFWTAITVAAFASLTVQVLLSQRGVQVTDAWRDITSGGALRARSALLWWVVAGVGLLAGAAVASALVRMPLPWRQFRTLRWIAGAIVLFALADVAHQAAAPEGAAAGIYLIATFLAVAIGVAMAALGTFFALRR